MARDITIVERLVLGFEEDELQTLLVTDNILPENASSLRCLV